LILLSFATSSHSPPSFASLLSTSNVIHQTVQLRAASFCSFDAFSSLSFSSSSFRSLPADSAGQAGRQAGDIFPLILHFVSRSKHARDRKTVREDHAPFLPHFHSFIYFTEASWELSNGSGQTEGTPETYSLAQDQRMHTQAGRQKSQAYTSKRDTETTEKSSINQLKERKSKD